ncbi:MAG: Tar ligand binding domain-containing protein [Oxalobacteraceae bacterium]
MKKNFPVTGHEILIDEDVRLVSRTDTRGIITFVNDAFVKASGFSREQLIGASHNMVRHPDVPPVVFENMWDTLKKGFPWRGVVKNRCKSGDHYWVDAHVVPVRKNGSAIGYMSARTKPTREAITQAETLYAQVARSGRMPHQSGGGWSRFLSVKNGVVLGIAFVTLMMIAGGVLGITGLSQSSSAMQRLYFNEMAPMQSIGRINFLMADNRAQVALALRNGPPSQPADVVVPIADHLAQLVRNKDEINALWTDYDKLARSPAERDLAQTYWAARQRYVEQGLMPARAALQQGDYRKGEALMRERVDPLYDAANQSAGDLLEFLADKASNNFRSVNERNELISIIAIAGISLGCLVMLLAGVYFFRGTVLPLQSAVTALERIAEGTLSGENDTSGSGEPGRVMTGVTVMQLHLKVMMDEIRHSSGSIREQCQRLNQTMMNVAQHSEEQHDRVYQTLDAATLACDGLSRLADDAQTMMQLAEGVDGDAQWAPLWDESEMLIEMAATATLEGVADAPLMQITTEPPLPEQSHAHAYAQGSNLAQMAQDLATAVRLEAFSMSDTVAQLNQVAMLIVENRAAVQEAWAASQQLEQTARELDSLVKYFD